MIAHLLASYLLGFVPMMAGLLWAMARVTRSAPAGARRAIADFAQSSETR
jgi:hypothetical protein